MTSCWLRCHAVLLAKAWGLSTDWIVVAMVCAYYPCANHRPRFRRLARHRRLLRFEPADSSNPCAGSIDFALAVGDSQTGLLRHMLYAGFCVDEADRLVLDGVLALIAGLRTEANWRFGQPSFIGADSPGRRTDPSFRRR